VFEELGAATNKNSSFIQAAVSLNQFAGQTIRIVIEASDNTGASLVEAAVDDVRITRQ
jgi:aminopeptidase S